MADLLEQFTDWLDNPNKHAGTPQQNQPWLYRNYDETTVAGLQAAMEDAYAGMSGNTNLNSNWSKEQYAGWQATYNRLQQKLNNLKATQEQEKKDIAQTGAETARKDLAIWAGEQVSGMPKYSYTPDFTKYQFTPEQATQWLAFTNEMYKPLETQGQQALAEQWNARGRLVGGGAYQAQRQLLADMLGKKMDTAIGLGERQTGRNIQAEAEKENIARYKYGTNVLSPWQTGYQTQFGLKQDQINELLRRAGLPLSEKTPISMPTGYTQEPGAFEKFLTAVLPTIVANIAAPAIAPAIGLGSMTKSYQPDAYEQYLANITQTGITSPTKGYFGT